MGPCPVTSTDLKAVLNQQYTFIGTADTVTTITVPTGHVIPGAAACGTVEVGAAGAVGGSDLG